MALTFSTDVRNDRLDAIETSIGASPILRIFSGSPPNTDPTYPSLDTVLVEMTLPSDWMVAASGGSKLISGSWSDASANATGTAAYFRIYDSAGNAHVQGTVTATGGGGDLQLATTSLESGQTVSITGFTLWEGNADNCGAGPGGDKTIYYISPTGSSGNDGLSTSTPKNLGSLSSLCGPGVTIRFMDGTYYVDATGGSAAYIFGSGNISTGSAGNPLRLEAAPGATPVFEPRRSDVTFDTGADTVTWTGHPLVADDTVAFFTDGTLPTGITAGTSYYVRDVTTNTFKIATTAGGAAIDLTGTPSGTHNCRRAFYGIFRFRIASYVHVKGLTTRKAPTFGFFVSNSTSEYITFENLTATETWTAPNGSPVGISLGTANDQTIRYCLIKNCDSYNNSVPDPTGDTNAGDGIQCAFSNAGVGNKIVGCRVWNNPDDGIDLFNARAQVILEDCWVFKNGWNSAGVRGSTSDGNGFKLGGTSSPSTATHILRRCLAWQNAAAGFFSNNNIYAIKLYNCAAYRNGIDSGISGTNTDSWARNYVCVDDLSYNSTAVLVNCMGLYVGAYSDPTFGSGTTRTTCSWQIGGFTSADLQSTDSTTAEGSRQSDGSLPSITFLAAANPGDLIDAGTAIGDIPYLGSAPDVSWKEVA